MFKRVWAFLTSDNVRWSLWWFVQFVILINYTDAFVGLNRPEIMPIAGAFATVFAWWFYTRQKGKHDDKAREYELDLIRMMVQFDMMNVKNTAHNIKGDLGERDYEIAKLRYDLGKLEDEVEDLKKGKPKSEFMWSLGGSNLVGRSRYPLPRRNLNFMRQNVSTGNYQSNVENFKKAIRDHRTISSRFGLLEGVAILYSAALSAFGADLVRWVHS